ncbi:transporter [Flavihumibacter fluvii]|uniref:transporter n=1 Tax=Flavihumibacter fluvii TaxID=2838157 RepID=UPI001BDF56CF|nr:transporter [Flavihumibacter fluvii]ULQ53190.1 transporter [Flavihumibacter fluvii]
MNIVLNKSGILILLFTGFLGFSKVTRGQDLEPRAYTWLPVNVTAITPGYGYSTGDVVTDPAIPIKDLKGKIGTMSLGLAHTFNMFGLTAQLYGVLPYTKAQASAELNGQARTENRTGLSDMRFRISALLLGAPATALKDFAKRKAGRTILGASLTVQAPTGQYFPDKIINIGANRWGFKPELAISQPLHKRWLLDMYAAVWLYTQNKSYYTGNTLRSQDPVGAFQAHTSYNFKPNLWAAINATYYVGGNSSLDGITKDDRLSNFRIGTTLVLPTGKKSALRLAYSKGAVVVVGTDFSSFSVSWTYTWY